MTKEYILVIKTGDAEIRAVENTSRETLEKVFPLIELTRGRKKTLDDKREVFPFTNRLSRLKEGLKGLGVAIDATSDGALTSPEVDELYEYGNGYEKWVDFVCRINEEGYFKSITPALIMNYDDPSFEDNLIKEIKQLSAHFDTLLYRNSIEDEFCYTDLPFILRNLPEGRRLLVLIDCSYTPQAMENNVSQKLLKRIENFKNGLVDGRCDLAFCATSFPNNISDIGGEDYDEFRIAEVNMHDKVYSRFPDVCYGDYGSINPKRNDNITLSRGWIPRIDVPLFDKVFYYRQRRAKRAYVETYKDVARKVVRDSKFPRELDCWGCSQINICCTLPPSSSPNYWISVRMNIHIEQQLKRLEQLNAGK
jgi:hypothetical protein